MKNVGTNLTIFLGFMSSLGVFVFDKALGLLNPLLGTAILMATLILIIYQIRAHSKKGKVYDALEDKAKAEIDNLEKLDKPEGLEK